MKMYRDDVGIVLSTGPPIFRIEASMLANPILHQYHRAGYQRQPPPAGVLYFLSFGIVLVVETLSE